MRRPYLHIGLALAIGAAVSLPTEATARPKTIKIATLAPEGSAWWKLLQEAGKEVGDRTDGRVRTRIYAGGVAGDEPDVVRKMRIGQLHGAMITSVGLGEIQPALLVLQAPGLFDSWEELDHVRAAMSERLAGLLAEKGFVNIMWGDIGFNRVFTNKEARTPTDLKRTKMWCWTHDEVLRNYFTGMGLQPVLVGVPEVLPGLQTGLLDAFSAPPLIATSLQWFSRVKYMLDHKQSITIGSVVLTQKALDKLSDADRQVVIDVGRKFAPRAAKIVREDNRRAIDAIRSAGIQVVQAQADDAWRAFAREGADAARGKVYSADLLAEVRRAVEDYRKQTKP